MINRIFERIPGTLANDLCVLYNVQLDVEAEQIIGEGGVEDAAVSNVRLAPESDVPDGGPYTLRYTLFGQAN